jgi:hypothetical protein
MVGNLIEDSEEEEASPKVRRRRFKEKMMSVVNST